jgi:serine/threonine protein kinase/Tol biopolymer transport system component
MNPERWQKIEQVFHAALQRRPEERASFLEQTCAGDKSLFSDVKLLLTSYGKDDSFFEDSASALAAEMFGDVVGETIGPYEVLSELGSGGMGTVYLAQDARLGRKIALKLLPPQFTNDKDRLHRFQQEARATSALNHPNILTVHEIEQKGELHYIATEFVDGVTLRQHLSKRQVNLDEVLNIAIQIASALQAAHAAGIAHRDIKPENVMVRADGYVKVLDFGLAKLTEIDEGLPLTPETNPGVVMGTPRYMSPEQARGLAVDGRTDIFSLGVIIYEMVAGTVPFDGATSSDVIAALLKDEPASLTSRIPEVPVGLERVVNSALAKKLDDRYQTVTELLSDLHRLKDEIQLNAKLVVADAGGLGSPKAHSEGGQTAAARRFRSTDPRAHKNTESVQPNMRRWALIISVGMLLLVAGVASMVYLSRRKETSTPKVTQTRVLTNRDGFVTAARFAPDGKGVIYSGGFDGRPVELFFTDVDGLERRPAGTSLASLKSVSSTTGKIAVLLNFELNWMDGRNGTLAILPAEGGKPEVLMDKVDEAAFAPDGDSIAIVRSVMGEHQLEYPVGQVLYKSSGWMSYPRFSPRGDKIAFFEHPVGDNSGSVVLFDLATRKLQSVSTGWTALKGLAWNPAGDEIWFGGSRVNRNQNINAVSLSGKVRLNIYELPGVYVKLEDISPDGRMLVSQGNIHTTMTILDGKSAIEAVSSRFAWSRSVDLSTDGKTLLYDELGYESSDPSDMNTAYLRKLDEPNPVRLGQGKALALSPDGKWALALQNRSQPQLVLLPISSGTPRALPNPGMKEYHYASFFPDMQRILFTAVEAREDAFIRSYVQDLATGDVHPLTEEGSVALRVSPDGKSVVTLGPDQTYYIQPLAGGDPTPVPGLTSSDEPIQWSEDSRALYVIGAGDFSTKIYRVDIINGRRRHWKDVDPASKIGLIGLELNPGGILITPNGKVCVYTYWTCIQQLLTGWVYETRNS